MAVRERARRLVRLVGLRALAAALPPAPPAGPLRRLLVVRPDHLGDLLFATPALRRLRRARPDAELVALAGPWGAPVLARCSALDSVLSWDIPWFNRRPRRHPAEPYVSALLLARLLAVQRFDAALVLRFDFWWGALAARLAGIPRRLGYDVPEVRPFLTDAVPYAPGPRHEVERNLALAAALLGPVPSVPPAPPAEPLEFGLRPEDDAAAAALLAAEGLRAGEPLLAIHPGAGAALKLWPAAGFAAVADALAPRLGARVVLTGSAGEGPLADAVAAGCRAGALSLAGRTSLGTLAAVFRRSRLVLGADSGPLHLAVAVGAPTVHLYGPVDARSFGPWGDPARHAVVRHPLPCSPCNRLDLCSLPGATRACVLGITPEEVLAAAAGVLAATEGWPHGD